ncbi:MAG: glycosyltransferase family 39 protein [Pseudomonadota bacterium]
MSWRTSLPVPVSAATVFGLTALILAWITGGLSPSLINPDEGGHYVNALFLGDWIRAGFPAPMAFAQDYYAHFPRLTIGHWPPGWYMLESPLFALFRPSPAGALVLAAFVAGLPAGAIVWAFQRLGRQRLGLVLGFAYVLLPLVVDGGRYILLDQPVALVVALAAIAWARASDRPGWGRFLWFAALAAACPLVKGNGALIALVPAIDIALTGRWKLLRQPALWVAALVTLAIVAPWYWLSFSIAAGGFNYAPGLDYAGFAVTANALAIWGNIGAAGIVLALIGAASAFRAVPRDEARIARLSLAVVLATLAFQSTVPAALEPRYVTPLLPWLVVLAGLGLVALAREGGLIRAAGGVLAWLALVPAVWTLWTLPPKPDIGAPALARQMVREGGLWLVDGRAGGEGALIAEAAWSDSGARRLWVSRASQWLSASDFMGRDYRLLAANPGEARQVLDKLGVRGVVSVFEGNRYAYPHSAVLHVGAHQGFTTGRVDFPSGGGSVFTARRDLPVTPNIALIEQNSGSANVAKMNAALR